MMLPPAPPPVWVKKWLGAPTGRGVRVGIIGTGFDRTIADPRVLPGVGLVDPNDDLGFLQTDDDHDRLGEGTGCASLVLRVAPDARVVPIRIFGGQMETSPNVMQAGLVWAVEQKLDVVCIGAGTRMESTLRPMYAACEKGARNGVVFVASAQPDHDWSYPGIFENVIGVRSGSYPTPFTFEYDPTAAYECQAAGEDQWALDLGGEEKVTSGTVWAAANMAGIVALLRERHPGAPVNEIRGLLRKFAL